MINNISFPLTFLTGKKLHHSVAADDILESLTPSNQPNLYTFPVHLLVVPMTQFPSVSVAPGEHLPITSQTHVVFPVRVRCYSDDLPVSKAI